MKYLNLAIREDVFLKKKAVGKKIEDLKPSDIKPWVRKFWWEKTSGMDISVAAGKIANTKQLQHFWRCLYGRM